MLGSSTSNMFAGVFSVGYPLKLLKYAIDFKHVCRKTTAGFLWGLVHALQLFRFVTMINAKIPGVLFTFAESLDVTYGEIERLERTLPLLFRDVILDVDVQKASDDMTQNFQDSGIDLPYTLLVFEEALTIGLFLLIVSPLLKCMAKTFSKRERL